MPDGGIVTTILGAITGLAAAVVTYLVAWRKSSGKVDTSDAALLWAEGTALRKELRDRVAELERRIERLEMEAEAARKEREDCRREADRLRRQLSRYEAENRQ
jgi:chromosome segregation ATPase